MKTQSGKFLMLKITEPKFAEQLYTCEINHQK